MKGYGKRFFAFALTALIASLTVVYAQSGKERAGLFQRNGQAGAQRRFDGPPPPPPGGLNPHLLSRLNLSDAQQEKIQALMEDAHTASRAYFEKSKETQDQLEAIVHAETFNEEQARTILAAKAQTMTEVELIHLRTDSAIYNLLTAEQKTQLEQLKQERPEPPPGERFGHGNRH